jgi:hypothetical protein
MSTAGSEVRSSAPADPPSTTTLYSPAGSPAESAAAPSTSEEFGVSGLGLTIPELPAMSAGTIFCKAMRRAAL